MNKRQKRETLIHKLEELTMTCHDFATDPERNPRERQDWTRLEAYLSQTLNHITNSHSIQDIKQQLGKLKKLVDAEHGKGDSAHKGEAGK